MAGGNARRRTTALTRGLSRRPAAVDTRVRFGAGGISRRFRNSPGRKNRSSSLRRRERIWNVSRKFSRIRFQFGRHKRGPEAPANPGGRNSEERKVLTGKERASESDFEIELTVRGGGDGVREIVDGVTVGVASDRSERRDGREETKRGGRGDSRIREETAPGAFPERLRP